MKDFARRVQRDVGDLRRTLSLLRKGLVRLGKVSAVDVAACTVVVEYAGVDALEAAAKSHPMPWLQRSTEHRPPAVGDHAVVIDPSLGMGSALAITGWPSTARAAPEGAAQKHVLYAGQDPAWVKSPDVRLGRDPTDHAALATRVRAELDAVKADLDAIRAAYNAHTHVVATSGVGVAPGAPLPATGTAAAPPAMVLTYSPQSVAAADVWVK